LASSLFNDIPLAARKLYYSHHRDIFSMCVMFLTLAAMHSAGFVGRGLRSFLSARFFYPIGQVSYSLYLVQEMVMLWLFPKTASWLGPALGPLPTMAAASVVAVLLSCVIAGLLYVLVEQPCMRARSHPMVLRVAEPEFTMRQVEAAS
jgi:peptidoglycan/LPS O-acetylase OafA/YrhL